MTSDTDTAAPRGVRARARAQLLADIGRIAREHLASTGAAALSVRAISREMGLASSALYRYYPSRDALLTRLIVESYDALGDAAETAERQLPRNDLAGRMRAIWHGVRTWALDHPHEYALIYGSPVPGYAAPDDTIDPAMRVARLFVALSADLDPDLVAAPTPPIPHRLRAQLGGIVEGFGIDTDPAILAIGVGQWVQLFGFVSFELFGSFEGVFDEPDELFEYQMDLALAAFGLA